MQFTFTAGVISGLLAFQSCVAAPLVGDTELRLSRVPKCGAEPCLVVAKPVRLEQDQLEKGMRIVTGPDVVLRVPGDYEEIVHNGAADIFKYPGHRALSLFETSVSSFSDLGEHPAWRSFRSGDVVAFYRTEGSSERWRGFVLRPSAKRYADQMLELYTVGFSQAEFEAIVGTLAGREWVANSSPYFSD